MNHFGSVVTYRDVSKLDQTLRRCLADFNLAGLNNLLIAAELPLVVSWYLSSGLAGNHDAVAHCSSVGHKLHLLDKFSQADNVGE